MTVRAKFKVTAINLQMSKMPALNEATGKLDDWRNAVEIEARTITLSPVYGNGDPGHENTRFWSATPQGSIVLSVVNPGAWSEFALDKEYYVDFTPTA